MELYSAWKEDQQQRSKGMKKYLLLIIRNLNSYHIILNYIKFFFTIFNTTLFSFHLCKKPIFSPRRHTSLFSTQRGTFLWTRATVKFSVFNVTLQENSSFLYLDISYFGQVSTKLCASRTNLFLPRARIKWWNIQSSIQFSHRSRDDWSGKRSSPFEISERELKLATEEKESFAFMFLLSELTF